MMGWAIIITNNTWMQCITKLTLERQKEKTDTHTHTHARASAGYTEQHPLRYKSRPRAPATLGLYFLERCPTVYISAGADLCVDSQRVRQRACGGGGFGIVISHLWLDVIPHPLLNECISSTPAGLFLNTSNAPVIQIFSYRVSGNYWALTGKNLPKSGISFPPLIRMSGENIPSVLAPRPATMAQPICFHSNQCVCTPAVTFQPCRWGTLSKK